MRPTRIASYAKSPTSSVPEIPVKLTFAGGTQVPTIADAVQYSAFHACIISPLLLERCGDSKGVRVIEVPDEVGMRHLVSVDIAIDHFGSPLSTSVLARVDPLPPGKDMIMSDPVLLSLADVTATDTEMYLSYPKWEMFSSWSLDRLATSAVLVLGSYTVDGLRRLGHIEVAVNSTGFRGWLMADYHDIAARDIRQKVITMAAASAFTIVEDSTVSGHLSEVSLIAGMGLPLVVVRRSARASSWMLDPLLSAANVRVFVYSTRQVHSLYSAIWQGCRWAQSYLIARAEHLDQRYPWRPAEAAMAKALDLAWQG